VQVKELRQILKLVCKPKKSFAAIISLKNKSSMQGVRKSRPPSKLQIKGWGIPLLGCLSISALFWCLAFWSGSLLLTSVIHIIFLIPILSQLILQNPIPRPPTNPEAHPASCVTISLICV